MSDEGIFSSIISIKDKVMDQTANFQNALKETIIPNINPVSNEQQRLENSQEGKVLNSEITEIKEIISMNTPTFLNDHSKDIAQEKEVGSNIDFEGKEIIKENDNKSSISKLKDSYNSDKKDNN